MTKAESNLGALAVIAAGDQRGVRSENPSHSMMVFGERERALDFIKDDARVTTPTAPESCYGKLYDMDGSVLLIGVSHNKNTYLHSVYEILGTENRMSDEYMTLSVKGKDGVITERKIALYLTDYISDISLRFHKYETAFRYHRCISDGFVGDAPAQLCSARGMKKVVELIHTRAGERDPLADEKPLLPSLYVNKK
jgi:aminoglycoside 3-N-acetyltransferase